MNYESEAIMHVDCAQLVFQQSSYNFTVASGYTMLPTHLISY